MLGGPLLSNTQDLVGEAGSISKGHYSGGKSSGGRSQLFLHVLPKLEQKNWGRGKRHTQGEESSFPRIRKGQKRGCYPTPISQTIAKVKDLVSESMRWVMGMWWGKQRMLERGVPSHTISPALENRHRSGRGQQGLGEGSQQSLVSFSKDIILFTLHVLKVKGRASHAFIDVFDVIAGCLKVCGGIIGAGTEHLEIEPEPRASQAGTLGGQPEPGLGQVSYLALRTIVNGLVQVTDSHKPEEKIEGRGKEKPHNGPCSSWSPPPLQGLAHHPHQVQPIPSLLVNGLQQLQCRLNFFFRLCSLHCGAGNGDVLALCSYIVRIGDHAHVDVCSQKGRR